LCCWLWCHMYSTKDKPQENVVFLTQKSCGSWHVWSFIHYNVQQYVVFIVAYITLGELAIWHHVMTSHMCRELQLFMWEKTHSLVVIITFLSWLRSANL
jgi:hypothetical protein